MKKRYIVYLAIQCATLLAAALCGWLVADVLPARGVSAGLWTLGGSAIGAVALALALFIAAIRTKKEWLYYGVFACNCAAFGLAEAAILVHYGASCGFLWFALGAAGLTAVNGALLFTLPYPKAVTSINILLGLGVMVWGIVLWCRGVPGDGSLLAMGGGALLLLSGMMLYYLNSKEQFFQLMSAYYFAIAILALFVALAVAGGDCDCDCDCGDCACDCCDRDGKTSRRKKLL